MTDINFYYNFTESKFITHDSQLRLSNYTIQEKININKKCVLLVQKNDKNIYAGWH